MFPFCPDKTPLTDRAPHVLEEAVALSEPVERVVALAHRPDEPAEGVDLVLALDRTAVLVNLRDGDLDRGVILGLDDPVGGAALPGDVAVKNNVSIAPSSLPLSSHPPPISGACARDASVFGGCVQVNNFALVVLHFGSSLGLAFEREGGVFAVGVV